MLDTRVHGTLPPPAPATEAQRLRQEASQRRLAATRLNRSALDLEAAAARLEAEARIVRG